MEWVEHNAKPDLTGIEGYFKSRMRDSDPREAFPIKITPRDSLGNTVYTSTRKKESLLSGEFPSTLLISPQGKDLLHHNPSLLSQIAHGQIVGEMIGEGDEGIIYKVPLRTAEGQKQFALKYTFPIHDGGDWNMRNVYTPGIDQMRTLQLAERENPVPEITYAVPQIATLDMTLSPFISDSVPASSLRTSSVLSEEVMQQRKDLVGNETMGELHTPFLTAYYQSTSRIKNRLKSWFENKDYLPTISHHIEFDANTQNPFLVRIPRLHSVLLHYQRDPELISQERQKEFDMDISHCLAVTEMVVGSE